MKKSILVSSFLIIALCLSVLIGSTFALFTSEDKVNIAVTSGTVEVEATVQDIVLYSMGEQQSGTFENGGTVSIDGGLLTLSNVTPGDKVTFAIKVNNLSNVRTIWRFVWECTEGAPLMSYMNVTIDNLDAGAIKSHRSAWEILDAAGDTVNVSIELPANVGNEAQNLTTKVSFKVEAVQANGADVDAKYLEAAETIYIEGYADEKVEVVAGAVKEEVEISSNGYEAIVPAGTALEAGATKVSLNVESAEANTGIFNFSVNGVETIGLNISIPEVAADNSTPIIIRLEKAVETLAADETLFMYHKGVQMTQVASEAEVNEAHEFYHDAATGDIVFATVNFSNFTIAKAKHVKVSTAAELEAAASKGQYVVLANDIELSKTLALKKDMLIDLNGHAISAGFTSGLLLQVYDKSNANVIITSSEDGAELNVFGNALILNYGTVEFSNVEINVTEIKSSSYTTFKTYGDIKLGKDVVVNVKYLGTSLISANGACEVVMDGATINVDSFVVNWSPFISKANATELNINQADINIESLGNATYPAYSYFTSDSLNVTINECNFDVEYDGVKYVAVDKDGKYKWVKAVSTVEELQAALENGETVVLTEDIKVKLEDTVIAPYGNKTAFIQNGGLFDGNGNTIGLNSFADHYVVMTTGGTIKNVTIDYGFRGIMIMYPTEKIVIDNVTLKGEVCYTINTGETGAAGPQELVVTNSSINGWTSIGSAVKSASFTNCEFGQGEYYTNVYGRLVKPYVDAVFENCDFSSKYYIDLSALGENCKVVFKNCTVNGVKLTAENWATLVATENDCVEGQISIEGRDGTYMTTSNVFDYVIFE